jgi:hypothetical protein
VSVSKTVLAPEVLGTEVRLEGDNQGGSGLGEVRRRERQLGEKEGLAISPHQTPQPMGIEVGASMEAMGEGTQERDLAGVGSMQHRVPWGQKMESPKNRWMLVP